MSSSKKDVDLITGTQVYVGAATVAGDRALSSGSSEGSAQKTTLVLVRTLQQDADAQSRCDDWDVIWSLSSSDKYKLNVARNNCFVESFIHVGGKVFSAFYWNTTPLLLIVDQRRMIFLRKTICSSHPILRTLGSLCNYDFTALAAGYNVNSARASIIYIQSTVWMGFVDSL